MINKENVKLLNDNNHIHNLKKCKDFMLLQESFTEEELLNIEEVLTDFEEYKNSCDLNEINIIEEYRNKFGNSNIVEWYEGLKTTEDFIIDLKRERSDEYVV